MLVVWLNYRKLWKSHYINGRLGFLSPSLLLPLSFPSFTFFPLLVVSQQKEKLASQDVFQPCCSCLTAEMFSPQVCLAIWYHSSLAQFEQFDGRLLVDFQHSPWFGAVIAYQYDRIPGGILKFFHVAASAWSSARYQLVLMWLIKAKLNINCACFRSCYVYCQWQTAVRCAGQLVSMILTKLSFNADAAVKIQGAFLQQQVIKAGTQYSPEYARDSTFWQSNILCKQKVTSVKAKTWDLKHFHVVFI